MFGAGRTRDVYNRWNNPGRRGDMSGPTPDKQLLRRHLAAMKIVHELDEQDRVLLLAYVVGGTPRLRELEEAEEAA